MKTLIVDDQASVHKYMEKVFDWPSLKVSQVYHAFNGNEALGIIIKESPDLILLDIKMPYMDGIELIKELDRLGLKHRTIILSAYNEFEYAREAMKFGVKDYILKPIDSKKLSEVIINALIEVENEQKKIIQEVLNAIYYGFTLSNETMKNMSSLFLYGKIKKYFFADFICRAPKQDRLLKALQEYFARNSAAADMGLLINANELLLFVPVREGDDYEAVVGMLKEKFHSFIEDNLTFGDVSQNIRVVAGFSETADLIDSMRKLYLHSNKATGLSFYSKEAVFMYTEDIFTEKVDKEVLNTLSNNIVDSVRMNFQEFKCIDLIGMYFDYFRKNRTVPEQVILACMNLVSLINDKLIEEYNDDKLFLEDVSRAYLNENFYIGDLELAFARNIFSTLNKIKSKRPKSDAEIVREIKKHIDDKYYEDLSLDGIS